MFRKKKVGKGNGESALVLFPDQLFPLANLPKVDKVYLLEDPLYFGNDSKHGFSIHGARLVHLRASMQAYMDTVLWPANIEVDYIENQADLWSGAGISRAALEEYTTIHVFEPGDIRLRERLHKAASELSDSFSVQWHNLPNFYLSTSELGDFFGKKDTSFEKFYQWQRERFNVLLTKKYKPLGGQWMLQPKEGAVKPALVGVQAYGDNSYVKEAFKYVEHRFDHYHDIPDQFIWPVTHEEAEAWLSDFTKNRLHGYSAHNQYVDIDSAWNNRSLLSLLLNCGLLSPQQVLATCLKNHAHKPSELADLELFVRNVLGWREFVRGFYEAHYVQMVGSNTLNANRGMSGSWFHGHTGLEPIDELIRKAKRNGYISTQEKTIIGSLMMMVGFNPHQVARWFSEMSLDYAHWALVPNVYAANQYAYGDKSWLPSPPLISSKQVVAMGVPADQAWQEVWDGLYHRFIDGHRAILPKTVVAEHDKLDEDTKRVLGYRAGDFLATHSVRG